MFRHSDFQIMMKHKRQHKLLAAALSGLLLASAAFSQIPASVSAESVNLISNSTFDSGTSDWGLYKESGGAATLSTDSGRLALHVNAIGKLSHSVQMYYDIIPLYKNGIYRLSYEISADTDRYIEGMIQQNGGTYQAYTWQGLDLTTEPQVIDYEFTMKADTDIMSKLVFNCGNEGEELGEHTIYLDNVVLELIDDSKVDYSEIRAYEPPIVTNQVGYAPEDEKIAVFREVTDETAFAVVNADTNKTVYTGELYGEKMNSAADETDWFGDFSEVTEPGSYYITCGSLDASYPFTIGEGVYSDLLNDAVRMLYLQRCGTEIQDESFQHPACHNTMARVYGTTDSYIDVSGGWHDAGDYGRYTVPAAKTVADMLYAYQANPSLFSDSVGIPESGNGVPDILDEARYALEWMLKMQDASTGGVHHKVTCENFPGYIMPQFETGELIVTPVSTTATGDFCGAMALAYEFFADIDSGFANTCLGAAEKAWGFLEQNPNMIFANPTDITTGDYGDTSDRDERYWAAAQLYRATGKEDYKNALSSNAVSTGMDWSTVGDYGNIALLTMDGMDQNSDLYQKALKSVTSRAASYAATSEATPYGVSITTFNWGSNMTVANAGALLGLTAQLTGEERYLKAAKNNLNYLLGKNPNGVCYVTGYGTVSPQNPHHRPSMAMKTAMKGMLVGGVNSNKEDSAAKAYLAGVASAKCYVDHSESYSTNEVTTYWNSPLIYLLALTQTDSGSTAVTPGDVNTDGSVTIADAVLLQKYLIGQSTLQKAQWVNGDVTADGRVNGFDLSALRQKLLSQENDNPNHGTSPDEDADMYANFREGAAPEFFASDGWSNGSCFDCGWTANNAFFSDNALNLRIDKDTTGKYNYTGGEYRTTDFYSYGYYETSMQAIKNDGVVSSFFTYTGPSDNNPWDEIDVEVLGKDTTKVQFNYYTNGVGNHEYMYDLGFDASEGYHTYGFDWQPDSITWYVDGKPVYQATDNIPSTPGKIMMNVWPGIGVDSWLKPFDGTTPLTAKYQWVTYSKN